MLFFDIKEDALLDVRMIYGIKDISEATKKAIEDAIRARGGVIKSSISRHNKLAVLRTVDEHCGNDYVALVASHRLDVQDPFSVSDLLTCQERVPRICIILVVEQTERGSAFMTALYNNGTYNCLYTEDTSANAVADMVITGRTASETRVYYGIGSNNAPRETLGLEKALDYVLHAEENGESFAERLSWVKDRLGQNEVMFRELMNRLPDRIKETLLNDICFEGYIQDYIKAKAEEEAEKKRQLEKAKELEQRERQILKDEARTRQEENAALTKISRALRRLVIGIAGTEHRVGCTHTAILLANYLRNQGYSVAVLEYAGNDAAILSEIGQSLSVSMAGSMFSYQGVDYYPNFLLSRLPEIHTRNYHFMIVDFGVYSSEIREEFGRCIQQIVVSGSKKWERCKIRNVFDVLADACRQNQAVNEDDAISYEEMDRQLSCYHYLFSPATDGERKDVIADMVPFKNVYFTDYVTDPFRGEKCSALASIMNAYSMSQKAPDIGSSVAEGSKKLLDKVRRFFE